MFKKYFQVYWLQAILSFVNSGFVLILMYHFYKQHVGLADIFLADVIGCSINALAIATRGKIHTRRDMQIGFTIMALSILFLITIPYSKPIFYLFYTLQVIGGILFFTAFNILYFEGMLPNNRMRGMTWYWIVGIISGIVGPLIGTYLFIHTGLFIFLCVPLVVLAAGVLLARYAPAHTIPYTTHDVLTRIKSVRALNLLDGALHRVNGDVALFALLFVGSMQEYGNYVSFVALVMAGFSWYIARQSDKTNRRMKYLWPAALIAGIATMLFSFADSLAIFVVLILITKSALIIAEPLRSNIMQDVVAPHAHNWISREFYLNVGRACIQLVAALILLYGLPVYAFILFGAMHIAYPLYVRYKKLYQEV